MGPALFGILLIAGTLQSYWYASFLMLFYSLGLFSTLFLVAFFFDKYDFPGAMNKINSKLGFSLTGIISGLLLISIGGLFIFYGGTSIVTGSMGLGNFTAEIYSLMDTIIAYKFSDVIGGFLLIGFLFFLWKVLFRGAKQNKAENN
jgi:hypothetical protein